MDKRDDDITKLGKTLSPLERKVLPFLKDYPNFDDIVKLSGLKDVEVMRALQWLSNKGAVKIAEQVKELVSLDKNGILYLEDGLPETRFLTALKDKELAADAVMLKARLTKEELNICIGLLKKKGAIAIKKVKDDLIISLADNGRKSLSKKSLEEQFLDRCFPIELSSLKDEMRFAFDELKKRKEIVKTEIKKLRTISLTDLGAELMKQKVSGNVIERLTPEIIKSGEWKNKEFREYDVKSQVPELFGGKRHFTRLAIDYMKKIWLEMGFTEMKGSFVQTSFWDLDSLFVPQDHPAREMQDTFYLADKKNVLKGKIPEKLVKAVKATHETGWTTGSKGWQCRWDPEKAKEVLLRTHTTVLSAQTIAKLKKTDLPAKFFSVNKVFRNETLDAHHLFEFYQVEGIVVDPDADFRHLIGYLKEFYKKMGYKAIRIRPAHFPYTEPSVEVDVLHPFHNKWIELGGAGIFRPEVVKPLLGFDCPVLAWGQGMERIITSYFNINDLRDIYKNDIKQLKEIKYFMM